VHGAAYARPLLLDQLEVIIGSVEIRAKIKQETGLNASAGMAYPTTNFSRNSPPTTASRTASCVYRKLKLGRSGGEFRQGWRVI
jgi:hypothetical protein